MIGWDFTPVKGFFIELWFTMMVLQGLSISHTIGTLHYLFNIYFSLNLTIAGSFSDGMLLQRDLHWVGECVVRWEGVVMRDRLRIGFFLDLCVFGTIAFVKRDYGQVGSLNRCCHPGHWKITMAIHRRVITSAFCAVNAFINGHNLFR